MSGTQPCGCLFWIWSLEVLDPGIWSSGVLDLDVVAGGSRPVFLELEFGGFIFLDGWQAGWLAGRQAGWQAGWLASWWAGKQGGQHSTRQEERGLGSLLPIVCTCSVKDRIALQTRVGRQKRQYITLSRIND